MHLQKIISKIPQCICWAFVFFIVLNIATVSHLFWKGGVPGLQAAGAARWVAKNPRLTTNPDQTTYILDISSATKIRIITLSNPYRVLVDLWDHRFERSVRGERTGQGLVLVSRYGQLAARVARTILTTKGPVHVEAAFVRARTGRSPPRLKVHLTPTDHASFIAGRTYLAPPVLAADKAARGKDGNKPVIIIDPGHGGKDSGAVGARGTQEKNINFSFSKALRSRLEATGRYTVHLTREGDGFLKLPWRVFSARMRVGGKASRSLFISIHADSVPAGFGKSTQGASVYIFTEKPTDKEILQLVKSENHHEDGAMAELQKAQLQAMESAIAVTESKRRYLSALFAKDLLSELGKETGLRWPHPREANFTVLTIPEVPSILLELGYISNLREEKLLGSQAWREKMAEAVARAIETYFARLGSEETGEGQSVSRASSQ